MSGTITITVKNVEKIREAVDKAREQLKHITLPHLTTVSPDKVVDAVARDIDVKMLPSEAESK